jgi:hypothetical protein
MSDRDSSRTRPKFAQIRGDQWTGLDELARDLQDARTVKAERITANTLIRVAIDGLLAHAEHLVGDNEEELRASLFARFEARPDEADDDGQDADS